MLALATGPPRCSPILAIFISSALSAQLIGLLTTSGLIAKAIVLLALTLIFTVDASRNASLWALVACGALPPHAYQCAVRAARAGASKPLR